MKDKATPPKRVWMHREKLMGFWFSVADECKEKGDVAYVPEKAYDALAVSQNRLLDAAKKVISDNGLNSDNAASLKDAIDDAEKLGKGGE